MIFELFNRLVLTNHMCIDKNWHCYFLLRTVVNMLDSFIVCSHISCKIKMTSGFSFFLSTQLLTSQFVQLLVPHKADDHALLCTSCFVFDKMIAYEGEI